MYFFIWVLLPPILTFQIKYIPKSSVLFGKKIVEPEKNPLYGNTNITRADMEHFLKKICTKDRDKEEEIWDSGEVEWEV